MADVKYVMVSREAWELWRAQCHQPQFLTVGSCAGNLATVIFTYHGDDALKRSSALHDAINAIALAALDEPPAASPPPPVDWERVGPELVKALENLRKEPIVAIRQENHRAKIQFTNVSNVLVQESCRQATAIIDAAIALANPDSPNAQ